VITRPIGAGAVFDLAISLPATAFFLTIDLGTPGRGVDALGDGTLFCLAALSCLRSLSRPWRRAGRPARPSRCYADCSPFASRRLPSACCWGTELALGQSGGIVFI
jgi:hypothetical protein